MKLDVIVVYVTWYINKHIIETVLYQNYVPMVFISEMGRRFPVIQTLYNNGFSSVYDDMTGDKMKR